VNPGDLISRYRIIGLVGKGGMGVVYQAEDTRLQRPVALKFLPNDSLTELAKYRFLNEARAAGLPRHPNICPIYDIEEVDGELFIVMAYLEGETLQRKLSRGPLEVAQAVEIALQVASGLACAHGLGIIHRDIKSGNIMVDRSGHVSIMDFGLALSSDALRITAEGTSVGTPAYMSPEQAQGHNVDARSDLWSLGVVIFEMVTGTLPFSREHRAALVHAILNDPAPDLSLLRPDLQKVIAKALVKDPAGRWQSASEMVAELKRLQGGTASGAVTEPEATATETMVLPTERPAARKRARIAAVALGVLIVASVGVGVYRLASGGRSAAPVSTIPAIKQVAVLPFQVTGGAEGTRTVADGLVEILTAALSDVERFQGTITAVPSSDLRRRGVTTPQEARRVFGVNLVIVGTAQTAGDKVEFTVNLMDALKMQQIATRTFLYDPNNPLVSRDQAVTQVVRMMNLDVPAAARTAISAGDTAAPTAYSAYIEGRGLLARYDVPGNLDRAIASFTKAARQDPKYALAYAGLGEAYWRKTRATGEKQAATLANQNAEYAVHLDGNLAIVHSVLGAVYVDAGRQEDAIREFQRAMELAPANAEAPRQLAEVYNTLGRFQEAEALFIRSTKSRPTDWYGHLLLGLFYYERERYPEAEAELNQAKSLTPDNDLVRLDLGAVYRMQGRYREASEEYQQALRIRTKAATYAALGGVLFYEHRFPEAVSAVEAAIDLDSNDYRYWGNAGIYYQWTPGSEAKSEPALRRAIELATKFAETRKSDYTARADLAEYRAQLRDAKGALAEIERIPVTARAPFTTRLAIVYELTGHRDKAIAVIRSNLKSPASLNQIKDNPDLAALWREAKLQ
jgi:serine/threonine-protein kinase